MQSRYNKMNWTITHTDGNARGWPFSVNLNTGEVTLTSDAHTMVYDRVCRQEWHGIVTVKELSKESSALVSVRIMRKQSIVILYCFFLPFGKISSSVHVNAAIVDSIPALKGAIDY